MTEQNPEQGHQDPAEQYDTTESVDTSDQQDSPEAPEPTEPAPVEVSPADQSESEGKTHNVLGQDYNVTPERGYRKQG